MNNLEKESIKQFNSWAKDFDKKHFVPFYLSNKALLKIINPPIEASILDIGCGTGKYLKILQAGSFKTDGIDSSETAVKMTKKALGNNSKIVCVNMFEFEIPKNKYDLVISISTIHHGTKEQVQNLINRIHEAVIKNGKVFITVPDLESALKNEYLKEDQDLGNGTYAPVSGPEKGLPHSHYKKEEVQKLFSKFRDIKLELDEIGRWITQATK